MSEFACVSLDSSCLRRLCSTADTRAGRDELGCQSCPLLLHLRNHLGSQGSHFPTLHHSLSKVLQCNRACVVKAPALNERSHHKLDKVEVKIYHHVHLLQESQLHHPLFLLNHAKTGLSK